MYTTHTSIGNTRAGNGASATSTMHITNFRSGAKCGSNLSPSRNVIERSPASTRILIFVDDIVATRASGVVNPHCVSYIGAPGSVKCVNNFASRLKNSISACASALLFPLRMTVMSTKLSSSPTRKTFVVNETFGVFKGISARLLTMSTPVFSSRSTSSWQKTG